MECEKKKIYHLRMWLKHLISIAWMLSPSSSSKTHVSHAYNHNTEMTNILKYFQWYLVVLKDHFQRTWISPWVVVSPLKSHTENHITEYKLHSTGENPNVLKIFFYGQFFYICKLSLRSNLCGLLIFFNSNCGQICNTCNKQMSPSNFCPFQIRLNIQSTTLWSGVNGTSFIS